VAEQAVPHVPQFNGSASRVEQLPLQFVYVTSQLAAQVPFEQTWPALQVFPQAPQLAGSLIRLAQTGGWNSTGPTAVTVLQTVNPSRHAGVHWPLEQPKPCWQTSPHPPQFSPSVMRSVHRWSPQDVSGAAHMNVGVVAASGVS
jgi:hypothetical protein